jgi:O-acetyl-ADP-ribose deacetylase (regulator of RNase III)
MEVEIGSSKLALIQGDITKLEVDAIVNAANSSLLGGGGVDGAIHQAAGPKLLEFCETLGCCPTGEAKITPGFDLKAKWVIHTVGPIYSNSYEDPILLASTVQQSLARALEKCCRSMVFPAISTGIYGYPKADASKILIETAIKELKMLRKPIWLGFCLFSSGDYKVFEKTLKNLI